MKLRAFSFKHLTAAWLAATAFHLPLNAAPAAAPEKAPAKPGITQSVFIMPVNPKEGRDPFFPNSIRVYRDIPVKSPDGNQGIELLKINGIAGSGTNLIVTINNHNFAVGEEGEINTSQGRIHLRCIAISLQTRSATIQVPSGEVRELFLPGTK
jgi:hypothetical protein